MTQFKGKITRDNAFELIKKFAKEYRKELGKAPGEIIFVGGGSIMLNYRFRDATQDFDVILKTVSGVKDVIAKFADDNELPRDWMNSDFIRTASYSSVLAEVSKHFCTLNNGTLEIRTVSGVYLIAMKLMARREYRNDISDAIGILIEEKDSGKDISYEDIKNAYKRLYDGAEIPEKLAVKMREICEMDLDSLKRFYTKQFSSEDDIGERIVNYIEDGASINAKNVEDVISRIKEKMRQ